MHRAMCLIGLALATFAFEPKSIASDTPLTLAGAVELAVSRDDPSVIEYKAQARSQRDLAGAQAQLPDPKVRFGIANLATDSFNFNQEQMTQLQLGLHQTIPTAGRRKYARARSEAQGDAFDQMAETRKLLLVLEVQKLWLKTYNSQSTRTVLDAKKRELAELLDALGANYEGGRSAAQNILSMEAEFALLEDRLQEIEQHEHTFRAMLTRFLGDGEAGKPLSGTYDDIGSPAALAVLEQDIGEHPALMQEQSRIRASDHSVSLAKESYKPNWGVDVGYGYRASGRADFASAMVTLDVPIFTAKRQDKRLSAAKEARQAAKLKMQAKELDMIAQLRSTYAVWRKTTERIRLYETIVLQRTKSASEATENAYSAGAADFAEVIRTHIAELDARLRLEGIRLENALARAELSYFAGVDQ